MRRVSAMMVAERAHPSGVSSTVREPGTLISGDARSERRIVVQEGRDIGVGDQLVEWAAGRSTITATMRRSTSGLPSTREARWSPEGRHTSTTLRGKADRTLPR